MRAVNSASVLIKIQLLHSTVSRINIEPHIIDVSISYPFVKREFINTLKISPRFTHI